MHFLTRNKTAFTIFTAVAAFGAYFCMYAFRKPFTAGIYEDVSWGILDLKSAMIIAQVLGYMCSKYIGIKVISELGKNSRGWLIMSLAGFSMIGLFLLGILPKPYLLIGLFLNGLPLGMIWGVVFSYLEGRRLTEILAACLSVSFIISSGVLKSLGRYIIESEIATEYWMPLVIGALFLPLLGLFTYMLEQVPPPTPEDIALRKERIPMRSTERRKVFIQYMPGLLSLVLIYVGMTVLRDVRDGFAVEIWSQLGYADQPMIFSKMETAIGILVLISIGLLVLVNDNKKAFEWNMRFIAIGILLSAGATWMFELGYIDAIVWMFTGGFGLFLAYVPFNCVLFDRLVPMLGVNGNAGFLIYLADAIGYSASVAVLFYKSAWHKSLDWLSVFTSLTYWISAISIVFLIIARIYFKRKTAHYESDYKLTPPVAIAILLLVVGLPVSAFAQNGKYLEMDTLLSEACRVETTELHLSMEMLAAETVEHPEMVYAPEGFAKWDALWSNYQAIVPEALEKSYLIKDKYTDCFPLGFFKTASKISQRYRTPHRFLSIINDEHTLNTNISPPPHAETCSCMMCKLFRGHPTNLTSDYDE